MKHNEAKRQYEQDLKLAKNLKTSRVTLLKSMEESLQVIIRLVYWLCVENVAMAKLSSLFLMVLTLPVVTFKTVSMNYINAARCREFVMALSAALKGRMWKDILESPFVSVLIDESTDISSSENLIIYIIYQKDGRAKATYVALQHAPAVDAEAIAETLLLFFKEHGLPVQRVACFCSDGASVMTGCKNGVGVRLQKCNPFIQCVHCIAHRLALCCGDTAADLDYPDMAENVVNEISTFFNRSSKRAHNLQEMAKQFDVAQTKIVKSGKTRWLSRGKCVEVLLKLLTVLVTVLGSCDKGDLTAEALHAAITSYMFVGVLCGMVDLLGLLNLLSQSFQHDIIDFGRVKDRLDQVRSVIISEFLARKDGEQYGIDIDSEGWDATWNKILDEGVGSLEEPSSDKVSEFLSCLVQEQALNSNDGDQEVKDQFIVFRDVELHDLERQELLKWLHKFAVALLSRLAERFPAKDMSVLQAFEIFNPAKCPPKPDNSYGKSGVDILCDFYGKDKVVGGVVYPAIINPDDFRVEWRVFKPKLAEHRKAGTKVEDMMAELLTDGSLTPNIQILLQIKVVLAYNTSMCERGFSRMKLIKSALRNRLYIETLDALMTIALVGPDYAPAAGEAAGVRLLKVRLLLQVWLQQARLLEMRVFS